MSDPRQTSLDVAGLSGARDEVSFVGRLRRKLFGISIEETRPERRGFTVEDPAVGERLARVGRTFLAGYHLAMERTEAESLGQALDATIPIGWRGFAYEGAAFGLAILDFVTPWSPSRFDRFVAGPAARHVYLAYVGLGWTFARLPRRIPPVVTSIDPHYRWLTLDGYGFHEGFFAWPKSVTERRVPRRLEGYARNGFDQGLGRSLWFVRGGSPEGIGATIATFPAERHGDLWSGVGLAATYAGGVPEAVLARLLDISGRHGDSLAQGSAFAAEARVLAEDPTPDLELACRTIWGRPADELAAMTRELGRDLPPERAGGAGTTAYEVWRSRVREEYHRLVAGSRA